MMRYCNPSSFTPKKQGRGLGLRTPCATWDRLFAHAAGPPLLKTGRLLAEAGWQVLTCCEHVTQALSRPKTGGRPQRADGMRNLAQGLCTRYKYHAAEN